MENSYEIPNLENQKNDVGKPFFYHRKKARWIDCIVFLTLLRKKNSEDLKDFNRRITIVHFFHIWLRTRKKLIPDEIHKFIKEEAESIILVKF